ncbi:hypothetical protein [Streptomyces sp. SPB162]|nr:hypothetical protein [Streptomyces sp. SPB162]MDF9811095.1 hypothetical protein [Streptomyces sp. SPB162]
MRTQGRPLDDLAWSEHEVTLEDLVLAYLTAATRPARSPMDVTA